MLNHRKLTVAAAGLMSLVLAGCYQYVPVDTSVSAPLGRRVAVDLTDRGRAALSERLGGGVIRIVGTVTADDTSRVVMNVWQVSQIGGGVNAWAGESVQLNRDYIGGVFEKKVSRTRSYLAAGVAVAAIVWVAHSQGLFGTSDIGDNSRGEPPPNQQYRGVP